MNRRSFYRVPVANVLLALGMLMPFLSYGADALCGATFEAERFGFVVQPVEADERDGCGRFLIRDNLGGEAAASASLAVVQYPLQEALRSVPSNFTVNKQGRVRFRLPRAVNDPRTLYSMRPLRVISQRTTKLQTGELVVVEYLIRVKRLKNVNAVTEEEVVEVQRCTNVVRGSERQTLIAAACEPFTQASKIQKPLVDLVESAVLQ